MGALAAPRVLGTPSPYWMATLDAGSTSWVDFATDSSGNIYVVVNQNKIIKFDSNGALVWAKTSLAHTTVNRIFVGKDGYLYVTGYGSVGNGWAIGKWSLAGTVQWSRTNNPNNAQIYDIDVDSSGNVYVLDTFYFTKFNSSGTVQWSYNYNNTNSLYGLSIRVTSNGIYIAGSYQATYSSLELAMVMKISLTGSFVWQYTITTLSIESRVISMDVSSSEISMIVYSGSIDSQPLCNFLKLTDNGTTASIAWQKQWVGNPFYLINSEANENKFVNYDSSGNVFFKFIDLYSNNVVLKFNTSNTLTMVNFILGIDATGTGYNYANRGVVKPFLYDNFYMIAVGNAKISKLSSTGLKAGSWTLSGATLQLTNGTPSSPSTYLGTVSLTLTSMTTTLYSQSSNYVTDTNTNSTYTTSSYAFRKI